VLQFDKQIRKLEQDFLKDGGLRERMTKARLTAHNNDNTSNSQPSPNP